ncbi:DNA excision repair protein ERCC-1 isoform X4 [Passer domesticus]|uniref:DNA excision repair protein ERCC-1 isoform X4 n=1 Tax=Passer domesticus TaxID=48849 RepID=UPI0030FE8829
MDPDPDPDPNPGAATDPAPAPAPGGKRRRFTVRQEGPEEPPVPSLFRASAAPVPVPVPVPIPPGPGSYAEFVVRGEGGTGKDREQNRDRERDRDREQDRGPDQNREQNRDGDPGAAGTALPGPLPGPLATPGDRDRDQNREEPRDQNRDLLRAVPVPVPRAGTSSSGVIVSPRQRGNPVLRFIRSVPWHFGDVAPDFVLGAGACALFLSLRYHQLHPGYIHERLRALGRGCGLRVLLLQVDVVTDCLTSVKSVNKTDALSLLGTFGSLAAVAGASRGELSLCPGVGPQKAKRLFDVLHEPFLKTPR